MIESSPYRILASFSLLLVLALPLGLQGVHPWLEEHEPVTHCESDPGQLHLHDQSFAFDHCFICTFHFSHYTEPPSVSDDPTPGWMVKDLLVEGRQVFRSFRYTHRSPRAPPADLV